MPLTKQHTASKQRLNATLARATAMLAILFGLAGCGPAPAPNEITIASTGMIFSVTEARAKVGREVILHLTNRDSYAHAFDIDEFNVHITLEGKATHTIRITPTQPGRFVYYCGSPGHRMAGMEGVLIVDP